MKRYTLGWKYQSETVPRVILALHPLHDAQQPLTVLNSFLIYVSVVHFLCILSAQPLCV